MRQILLADRYRNAARRRGQLLGGIDDAAVVLPILLGSQDKQAVGQLPVGCFFDGRGRVGLGRRRLGQRGSDSIGQILQLGIAQVLVLPWE